MKVDLTEHKDTKILNARNGKLCELQSPVRWTKKSITVDYKVHRSGLNSPAYGLNSPAYGPSSPTVL